MTAKRIHKPPPKPIPYPMPAKRRVWVCGTCGILGDVGKGAVRWLASDKWLCQKCGGAVTRETVEE